MFDTYANPYAVAAVAGGAKFNTDSFDQINLNDPNLDVLTPLSDIAMVSGHNSSFGGADSGYYPSQSQSSSRTAPPPSARGYDQDVALSELYPSDILASTGDNDVCGDSDDDDDEIGASSFGSSHSTFDMPSASEWHSSETRDRAASGASSVDSHARETSFGGGHPHDSDLDEHGNYLEASSYSEFSTNFSECSRGTGSEYSEYNPGATRFDSNVFSDVDDGVGGVDSDSDSDSDDDVDERYHSYSSGVVRSTGAEFHDEDGSTYSSSDDDDDDADIEDVFGGSSFSSESSFEV